LDAEFKNDKDNKFYWDKRSGIRDSITLCWSLIREREYKPNYTVTSIIKSVRTELQKLETEAEGIKISISDLTADCGGKFDKYHAEILDNMRLKFAALQKTIASKKKHAGTMV
jgi:hypothetical protein